MNYDESITGLVNEIVKRNPEMRKKILVRNIRSLSDSAKKLYEAMYPYGYEKDKSPVEQYANSLMNLIEVALKRYQAALELNDLKVQNAAPEKIKEQEEKCHELAESMGKSENQVKELEEKLRKAEITVGNSSIEIMNNVGDKYRKNKADELKKKMFEIKDNVLNDLDIVKLNEKLKEKKEEKKEGKKEEYSIEDIIQKLKEKYPDGKIPKDAISQLINPEENLEKKEKEIRLLDKLRSGDYVKGPKSKVQKVWNFTKKHPKAIGTVLVVALGGIIISSSIYGTPLAIPARILSALWHPLHHIGLGEKLHGLSDAMIGGKGTYNPDAGSWILNSTHFNTFGWVDWTINAFGAGLLAASGYGIYRLGKWGYNKIKNRLKNKDSKDALAKEEAFLEEYREKVSKMNDEQLEEELNAVKNLLDQIDLGSGPRELEHWPKTYVEMLKICREEQGRRKVKSETKSPKSIEDLSLEQLEKIKALLNSRRSYGAYPINETIEGIEFKADDDKECERLLAQIEELIAKKNKKEDKKELNNIESLSDDDLQQAKEWLEACLKNGTAPSMRKIGDVTISAKTKEDYEKLLEQVNNLLAKRQKKDEKPQEINLETLSDKELIDKYLEAKAKADTDTQAQDLMNKCETELNNRNTKLESEIKSLSDEEIKKKYQMLNAILPLATDEVVKNFVSEQLASILKEEIKQRTIRGDWIKKITPDQANEFLEWGNKIINSKPESINEMTELNGELLYFDDLGNLEKAREMVREKLQNLDDLARSENNQDITQKISNDIEILENALKNYENGAKFPDNIILSSGQVEFTTVMEIHNKVGELKQQLAQLKQSQEGYFGYSSKAVDQAIYSLKMTIGELEKAEYLLESKILSDYKVNIGGNEITFTNTADIANKIEELNQQLDQLNQSQGRGR